ncbi:MAG TPA: hypothetical protein VGG40_10500 [Solirubrobacterales bacterium]|jgi:hypothetical protein
MGGRTLGLAFVLVLAGLAVAAVAGAKPVTPSSGPFSGSTSQKLTTTLAVSKAGAGRKVELKSISIEFSCSSPEGTLPLNTTLSSKAFKEHEKGLPMPVRSAKFSYKGPLYIGLTHPTIQFAGTFKSAEKVVGTLSVTAFTTEPEPGFISTCGATKLSFNAKHA